MLKFFHWVHLLTFWRLEPACIFFKYPNIFWLRACPSLFNSPMISSANNFPRWILLKFQNFSTISNSQNYHNFKASITAQKSPRNSQTNRRATISTCARDSHRGFTKQSRSCETLPDMKFFLAFSKIFIAEKSRIIAQIFLIFASKFRKNKEIHAIKTILGFVAEARAEFCGFLHFKVHSAIF